MFYIIWKEKNKPAVYSHKGRNGERIWIKIRKKKPNG